jgi:nucleotide-binding universal stress UspA family protein
MAARTRLEDDGVLVGVDGSEESLGATRWAAREAALRGTSLQIVHAWLWPMFKVPLEGSPLASPGSGLKAQAEAVLDRAAEVARSAATNVPVETCLTVGSPTAELLSRSPGAQLLVVGNRGLGGFTGLLLGSTGIALSARAACPVVVVRGTAASDRPVLAGIDGSDRDSRVVRSALHEAALRSVDLIVVHSWTLDLTFAHSRDDPEARDYEAALSAGRRHGEELLAGSVDAHRDEFPAVPVRLQLADHSPAADLVAASQEAQLVVLGSHGAGALRGALLGSTTHAVIHHSACPVLIERGRETT